MVVSRQIKTQTIKNLWNGINDQDHGQKVESNMQHGQGCAMTSPRSVEMLTLDDPSAISFMTLQK
jgi:hypothetical protein